MGLAGIEGLRRGKKRKTTKADPSAERHPDLVKRVFSAERPNALWVSGPDVCGDLVWLRLRVLHHRCVQPDDRRLEGGEPHASRHGPRRPRDGALETRHHARGSDVIPMPALNSPQFATASTSTNSEPSPPSEAWATRTTTRWPSRSTPPTRASSSEGPGQGPWRNVDDVELATLAWVTGTTPQRLHEYLGYVPPAEFEAAYAAQQTDQELVGINSRVSIEGGFGDLVAGGRRHQDHLLG